MRRGKAVTEDKRQDGKFSCYHNWEVGGSFGVIIGLSQCKLCGKIAESKDFVHSDKYHS
jgi:hypothetical protein